MTHDRQDAATTPTDRVFEMEKGEAARVVGGDDVARRQGRDAGFELVLSTGLPTRVAWLEFTAEAIFAPFDRESTPELEIEANVTWLDAERTGVG